MKKRILFAMAMVIAIVCLFAISVSADNLVSADSDAYGTVSTIDSLVATPENLDTTSKVVIKGADGKYYTFPSYYVLADNTTLTWKLPDEIKTALGLTYTNAKDVRLAIVRMEVPNGITEAGNYAFEKSTTLLEVYFPSSLEVLGNGMFKQCTSIVEVSLVDTKITEIKGAGNHAQDSTFRGVTSLTKVTLPKTLEKIGGWAFCGCTGLSDIDLKNTSVQSIGDYAFEKAGVKDIYLPDTLTTMGTGVFNVSTIETLRLSSNLTTIGTKMCNSCSNLTTVTNMENTKLTSIPTETFRTCRKLTTNFKVPNTVTSIGQYGFADIAAVNLSFGANITSIHNDAFVGCSSLKVVFVTSSDENYVNNIKSKTKMSNIATYTDYSANPSEYDGGKYVISGCDICETLYGGIHQLDPAKSNACAGVCANCGKASLAANPVHDYATTIVYTNYLANGTKTQTCQNAGCAHNTTPNVTSVDPIISSFKGFSTKEIGNGLTFGYTLNLEAIKEYEAVNSTTLEFGFVVAVQAFLGDNAPLDKDGNAASNNVIKASITSEDHTYTGADFRLTSTSWDGTANINGVETALKDIKFYMAGYILDGASVVYINSGATGNSADAYSYRDIAGTEVIPEETPAE